MWHKINPQKTSSYPKSYDRVLVRTNYDTFIGYVNRDFDVWFIDGLAGFDFDNDKVIAWQKLPKFRRKDSKKMTKIQLLGTIIVFLLWFIGMNFWVGRDDE